MDCPERTVTAGHPGVLTGTALATTLTRWGAVVSQATIAAGEVPTIEMSTWLAARTVRRIAADERATIG